MADQSTVLILDDSAQFLQDFKNLTGKYFTILTAQSEAEAIQLLNSRRVDAMFLDLVLGNGISGKEVLTRLKESFPDLPVIMMTAHTSVDTAVEAMKLGAFHYLSKEINVGELRALVGKAIEERSLKRSYTVLRDEVARTSGTIVGKSRVMEEIFESIRRVAMTDVTVLITGESGTGKELVSREIHQSSKRSDESFVAVNCGSLVKDLIESELFGHVKGSFTGAVQSKIGKFELAEGGTIFLDEVAELDGQSQVKLLRVLQEKEIDRVGGTAPIPVDVRVIAATNRDLATMTQQAHFREDLFYRLNVYPISLPPLRAHKEDIPPLVDAFLAKYATALGKPNLRISPAALNQLMAYHWPGNVRELENVVQRAILLSNGEVISPENLPKEIGEVRTKSFTPRSLRDLEKESRESAAREIILQALEQTGWSIRESAKLLSIPEKTLYDRCKRLGIKLSRR
ncbi:MAG TPA: sigma-54 dependent transcriptional regulator [Bacteroidota bacterium]|nr:sigma-54 dependent transcriptional regulator [Bacteroidota bacterium]